MDEKKPFKKGEFLTNTNKPGSFAIFEGIERDSNSVTKRYSTIAYYEPNKYREITSGHWGTTPFFENATKDKRSSQTVEGLEDSYWWRHCTDSEKEKALTTLFDYGFYWNEDTNSLIDKETGEIVRTVVEPSIKYNGEIVKPITEKFKELLRKICKESNNKKYAYDYAYQERHYWEEDCWGYYE